MCGPCVRWKTCSGARALERVHWGASSRARLTGRLHEAPAVKCVHTYICQVHVAKRTHEMLVPTIRNTDTGIAKLLTARSLIK